MAPTRLAPATPRSRVKHSSTEPLPSPDLGPNYLVCGLNTQDVYKPASHKLALSALGVQGSCIAIAWQRRQLAAHLSRQAPVKQGL